MKSGGTWGVVAAALLLPAVSYGQSSQTAPQPLAGAHSRGVQVVMPGQAAVSDSATASTATNTASPAPSQPLGVQALPAQPVAPKPVFFVAPVARPIVKACEPPFQKSDITLGDKGFDRSLSSALKGGGPVIVSVSEPFDPAAEPPASLSPWLKAAKAGGGAVTVTPYCTGRGILHDWVDDVVAHMSGRIYRPARNYDVILYADAARRQVTQLQFKPKPSVVAAN